MSGFFLVTDVPSRRVVQYKRSNIHFGDGPSFTYIEDESVLGASVDEMPYADKTGIASVGGTLFEVPYLEDAGDVYFAVQPEDSEAGATLIVSAKAGKAPYAFQWYKDDKQVVNVPDSHSELKAAEPGKYFCVVTDADGVQAVSKAAEVK